MADVEEQLFGGKEAKRIRGPIHLPSSREKAVEVSEDIDVEGPLSDMRTIDKAALATAPVPVIGDVVGAAADVSAIADNPTPFNITMGTLGLLPFVPSGMRAIGSSDEVSETFKKGVEKALASGANDPKSREALVEMKGDDFLSVVKPGGNDSDKLERLRQSLEDRGEQLEELPTLWLDDTGDVIEVSGHEGRHRIKTLKKQGKDRVPVRIIRSVNRGEFNPPDEVIEEGKRDIFEISKKTEQRAAEGKGSEAETLEELLFGRQ